MDGEGARRCRYLENLCHGMRSIKVPIIAAVEGMAVGSLMPRTLVEPEKANGGRP